MSDSHVRRQLSVAVPRDGVHFGITYPNLQSRCLFISYSCSTQRRFRGSHTMLDIIRAIAAFVCLLAAVFLPATGQTPPSYPSFDYDSARSHELKPHRSTIPLEGVQPGFNQLRITLVVSPTGDVVHADASGGEVTEFWPKVRDEVNKWKFTPFEEGGKAVTAEIEEYVDLVPPERLPAEHVAAPVIRSDSKVKITLERTGCYGSC